jgi:hypothetical protein
MEERLPLKRDEKGRLVPGTPGGPGRPKGQTMKEFAREFLMKMSPEEKEKWLQGLSADIVWRMAEGNPHNTNDLTSKDQRIFTMPSELLEKNDIASSAEPNSEGSA